MIRHLINRFLYNEKYRNTFLRLGELLLGAIIGFIITLPSDNSQKITLSLIIAGMVVFICFLWYLFQEKDPRKFDILNHVQNSDYEIAISWVYTMRNLLSHAGYIKLKVELAEIAYSLMEDKNIDESKIIYDTNTTGGIIRATLLMDDFGWYSYELSLNNAEKSLEMIEKGIAIAIQYDDKALAFRGYRHKSNLFITQGRVETEKQAHVIDELSDIKEDLSRIKTDALSTKIEALVKYIEVYQHVFRNEYQVALRVVEQEIDNCQDNEVLAKFYEASGIIYYNLKQFENANSSFEKAMKAAKALRPGRYLSIVIIYFISKKAFFDEQYNKYSKSLNKVGREQELRHAKEIFETAKKIAVSRDSNKIDDLVKQYKNLKKSIKRR